MATFVLVHGAWHGGWCWRRVERRLRAAGHDVYVPTLTGLGDRGHLANKDVDLQTHISDVTNHIDSEELSDVVLVGHSYGGMVISGVAALLATRLDHLIYLDGFVPLPDQSLLDLVSIELADDFRARANLVGDGWLIPPPLPARLGITDAEDASWVSRRLLPQPFRTFEQPFAGSIDSSLKRTYIYCSASHSKTFLQFATYAKGDPSWRVREIETGHDAMITEPEEVTRICID